MRDRLDEMGDDTAVALITFTSRPDAQQYLDRIDLPFPLLLDPSRGTYRAYGLGRGSRRRVWGARAARRYLDIIREQGWANVRRPREDPLQLGGDFVIDPAGRLSWGFWGDGPDDRPPISELVAAVQRARRDYEG